MWPNIVDSWLHYEMNLFMRFLMIVSFLIDNIGHAVNPVFHVLKSENQIYILNLKSLAVCGPKDSWALDLGFRSFVTIKNALATQMGKISKVLFGLSVVYLGFWNSNHNIYCCAQFVWRQIEIDLFPTKKTDFSLMTDWKTWCLGKLKHKLAIWKHRLEKPSSQIIWMEIFRFPPSW
jgi:hypothetical protein